MITPSIIISSFELSTYCVFEDDEKYKKSTYKEKVQASNGLRIIFLVEIQEFCWRRGELSILPSLHLASSQG